MQTVNWSGIDVAKDTFDGSILAWNQDRTMREVIRKSFKRTKADVKQYLKWLDAYLTKHLGPPREEHHSIRIVMDSTGRYSMELCAWLLACREELQPAIVNPRFLKQYIGSLGLRNKTDDIDSRAHCLYGYERKPKGYEPLAESYQQLRDLVRERAYIVKSRAAEKVRVQEALQSKFIQRSQKRRIKFYDRQIEIVETEMKKVVDQDEELSSDIKLLTTIRGVAETTAMRVLGELGDLRRFGTASELSAFSGLSPKLNTSGKHTGKTTISRIGSPELRAALYMPALATIQGDHPLAQNYQRLIANGKEKKSAICAIMRKTLLVMRSMLIHNEPYRMTLSEPKNTGENQPKKDDRKKLAELEKAVENLRKKMENNG